MLGTGFEETNEGRKRGREEGGGPIIGQFWSTPIKPCGPVVGQKGSIRLRERGGGRGDVKKVVI